MKGMSWNARDLSFTQMNLTSMHLLIRTEKEDLMYTGNYLSSFPSLYNDGPREKGATK